MRRNTWRSGDARRYRPTRFPRFSPSSAASATPTRSRTSRSITQRFPPSDVDIALRVDADCMRDIEDSQTEWAQEKPAIEQEVARDFSNPTYKFMTRLNEDMFSGTAYSHDPLGTKDSFDATTGEMLKDFYDKMVCARTMRFSSLRAMWTPPPCLRRSRSFTETSQRKRCPRVPKSICRLLNPESFTLDSNLPYLLAFVAYRLPGTDSPDFAAAKILTDVLASERGKLYDLVPQGKALQTEFGFAEAYNKGQRGV